MCSPALGLLASAGRVPWREPCARWPGSDPRAPVGRLSACSLCPAPSMMEYSLDGHNVSFSAIRTVRVLRPLRAINRVPSK